MIKAFTPTQHRFIYEGFLHARRSSQTYLSAASALMGATLLLGQMTSAATSGAGMHSFNPIKTLEALCLMILRVYRLLRDLSH